MPPLIIALTPTTAAFLSPDGRTYRADLTTEDDPIAAAANTWSLEFPDILTARLWLAPPLADPATARRFRSESRQAGLRVESAWPMPESFVLADPDDALADSLSELRSSILTENHNLLRRPKVRLKVNRRKALGTAAIFVAAIATGVVLQQRARRRDREATSSAAAQREAEFAAAGRRREHTLASAQALLAAARPPRPYVGELLHALSDAIPLSAVVDELTVDGPNFKLVTRAVPGAPGGPTVAALLRKTFFPPTAPWRLTTAPPETADPSQPTTFEATLEPIPPPLTPPSLQTEADQARAALPPAPAVDALLRTLGAAWTIQATPASTTQIPVVRVTLTPRNPAAWPALLLMVTQLDRFPGASIDHLEAKAAPDESGAFATLHLAVTFRLKI